MLKDITIGQFFPGNSVIHRMDSRVKIILELIYIVMLFIAQNFYGLAIAGIFMLTAFIVSGISLRMILKSLKPILPIILFTAALNILFVKGDSEPLLSFWIFEIHYEGIELSLFMIIRIICTIIIVQMTHCYFPYLDFFNFRKTFTSFIYSFYKQFLFILADNHFCKHNAEFY